MNFLFSKLRTISQVAVNMLNFWIYIPFLVRAWKADFDIEHHLNHFRSTSSRNTIYLRLVAQNILILRVLYWKKKCCEVSEQSKRNKFILNKLIVYGNFVSIQRNDNRTWLSFLCFILSLCWHFKWNSFTFAVVGIYYKIL